jgi:endoglucanase
MALIQAYKLSGDKKYLKYALTNLDYLLGRNGTGYSYVTGYGSKTPMHPHHRPSVADGVVDPVPGLLVGGPNAGMQDHVKVPSTVPDEAYIDNDQAYAVNEIAINWNAPFAYLSNAIEALQSQLNN